MRKEKGRRGIESWGVGASHTALPPLATVPVRLSCGSFGHGDPCQISLALPANESRLPAKPHTWLFWASDFHQLCLEIDLQKRRQSSQYRCWR